MAYAHEIQIITLDVYGVEVERKIVPLMNSESTEFTYDYVLSPDGLLLAYKRISGTYGISYDTARIQDVEILGIDGQTHRQGKKLTERGGAWFVDLTWSPDSRYLAFTDFDENHVQQILLYEPVADRIVQLTDFGLGMKDYLITGIYWSPDSSEVAFSAERIRLEHQDEEYYTIEFQAGGLGIIKIDHKGLDWIFPFEDSIEIEHVWWGDFSTEVLFLAEGELSNSRVIWYNLISGEQTTLNAHELDPDEDLWHILPLKNDLSIIGIFGKSLYIFDRDAGAFSTKDRFTYQFETEITSPSNSLLKKGCTP
ncbi:MAG: hypothetical protein FJZ98_04765 [Chloroflexi bacterium]|nr:hypothetical protein [Chloroflexota bacterium]